MLVWHSNNPQNKFGRHAYSLEQYGLSEAGIRAAFADYEAFNVVLEAA
jgi:hypothetical protein